MTCPDFDEPTTIPWPESMVEELAAKGLRFTCGLELYGRLSSRSEALGWDPARRSWAGIPLLKSKTLPPRAFVTSRDGVPVAYIGDVDEPEGSREIPVPASL